MNGPGPSDALRDPGLQAERTALSWTRTALSLFVNALLVLRMGTSGGHGAITALGLVLLLAAAAAAACGGWRRHRLLHASGALAVPALAIVLAAAVTWLACIAAVAAVLAPR